MPASGRRPRCWRSCEARCVAGCSVTAARSSRWSLARPGAADVRDAGEVGHPGVLARCPARASRRTSSCTRTAGCTPARTRTRGRHDRSRVFEWTAGGTLLRSWTVPGQNLDAEHGVQVANADARGRLVLLEKSTAPVLTLEREDRPVQAPGDAARPAQVEGVPIPNYATWGPDGALFVTDYGQAVIWRIPAAGGTPKVWFCLAALDGPRVRHHRDRLPAAAARLPDHPADRSPTRSTAGAAGCTGCRSATRQARHAETLWTSRPAELPDGFGIARSGRIYIASVG